MSLTFDQILLSVKDQYTILPRLGCSSVDFTILNRATPDFPAAGPTWPAKLRSKAQADQGDAFKNVIEINGKCAKQIYMYKQGSFTPPAELNGYLDDLIRKQGTTCILNFNVQPNFIDPARNFNPPLDESFVLFQRYGKRNAQPFELATVLRSINFKGVLAKTDSLIFNLFDNKVSLPILPVRLHFDGYFTTLPVKAGIYYDLLDYRYSLTFIGVVPETTPLQKVRALEKLSTYATNMAISKMATAEL